MCAKNHLLIFSSFLDIWENVEWPRFFGPPCITCADIRRLRCANSDKNCVLCLYSGHPVCPIKQGKELRCVTGVRISIYRLRACGLSYIF